VAIGLAHLGPNGELVYHPRATNTYVILVTDNGSTGNVVKVPFDISRAKSTPYQTGVWVPALVAGPGVRGLGREVAAMVNIVDLYELVGELAGIEVHKAVPRIVDSKPLLAYLKNPKQRSIRETNFSQIGTNEHANGKINGPCQYNTTTCTQIAPSKGVCEDNNGIWWGPGANDPSTKGIPPEGLPFCCDVAIWQHDHGQEISTDIYPLLAYGIRNDHYKLVINNFKSYDDENNACPDDQSVEFYKINQDVPQPELDIADADLLANGRQLTPVEQQNFDSLNAEFNRLLASQPACPGDINLDGAVNQADIDQWNTFKGLSKGLSSWADLNQDGLTNDADLDIIQQHQGACPH